MQIFRSVYKVLYVLMFYLQIYWNDREMERNQEFQHFISFIFKLFNMWQDKDTCRNSLIVSENIFKLILANYSC